jgi:two-component system, cell cycle response regulator
MDLLVRVALRTQRWLYQAGPTLLALACGTYIVLEPLPRTRLGLSAVPLLGALLLTLLLTSVSQRLWARFRRLDPELPVLRESEIGLQLAVCVYATMELVAGGPLGPVQALPYALMTWIASVFSPWATGLTLLACVALECALGRIAFHTSIQDIALHIGWLALFAAINLVMVRAEITRVRRLSREMINKEILQLKETARLYRLNGAPRSAVLSARAGAEPPAGDSERLMQSSVEHLQLSLRFMLFLVRKALGLRTAAILWLGEDARELHLREASSAEPALLCGPFRAREGVFAACLSGTQPVAVDRADAQRRFPLYSEPRSVSPAVQGVTVAVPLQQHEEALGVLLVDVEHRPSEAELQLMQDAAAFALRSIDSERLLMHLERTKTEQGKLYHAADLLSKARTEGEVIRAGVKSARQFASFDFAAVTLFHASTGTHEICAVSGPNADDLVGRTFDHNTGLVSMVLANRHALPYRGIYNSSRHRVFADGLKMPQMPSLTILPLYVHDMPLGTLLLGSYTEHAFAEESGPTLEVLARHIAASLANARMVKRLEDLATTDGLTGLLNKRALTEVARQKLRSAKRFNKPLSVVIGDIDLFKRVNDTHGHDVGDVVIKGFGAALRRSKRETDSVGRFGGEEFVLVCEETDEAGGRLLAERIRQDLENSKFHTKQGPLQVTCSLGVATFPQAGKDWEVLFKAADEALYASKREGRNRVTVWDARTRSPGEASQVGTRAAPRNESAA